MASGNHRRKILVYVDEIAIADFNLASADPETEMEGERSMVLLGLLS
jgi:hypothetical protein